MKKKQDAKAYINPEKALEAKERGNVHFKAGKFPQAIEEYTEAINREPTNPTYYSNRAAAYQKLMDFQKAVEDSKLALKQDPKFTKAWMRKAGCEFFLKEYHKCMDSWLVRSRATNPRRTGRIVQVNKFCIHELMQLVLSA